MDNVLEKDQDKMKRHPCFYGKSHGCASGRLHLPVSPECNIRCLFCRRAIDDGSGKGPGLTRGVLPLNRVLDTVKRALIICPDIKVVGVAGPGDALASRHAVDAFKLVKEHYPELMTCLSTNGLMLEDMAEELIDTGVNFITVTVNAASPESLVNICGGVFYKDIYHYGVDAARLLVFRQELGIRRVISLGGTVKVNSVLVPGVNDHEIGELARNLAEWGVSRINIIPLIPQFGMSGQRAPSAEELESARKTAGEYLEVITHCARCRADACGVPGVSDYSKWLYGGGSGGLGFSHG